jgi:hypothetical protein
VAGSPAPAIEARSGEGAPQALMARTQTRHSVRMSRLFMPTARQINWLLIAGFLALGYALYIRYLWIEQSAFGLACDGGLKTWSCLSKKIVAALFDRNVFGIVALALAALHVVRPTLLIFGAALVAAGFGIVLYNVALSSLAVGLLILSFARRAPATD